jgi:hypothetical protein
MYLIWLENLIFKFKSARKKLRKPFNFPLAAQAISAHFLLADQPIFWFSFYFFPEPAQWLTQPTQQCGPVPRHPQLLTKPPSLPPSFLAAPSPVTSAAGHHAKSSPLPKWPPHLLPSPFTSESGAHPMPQPLKWSTHWITVAGHRVRLRSHTQPYKRRPRTRLCLAITPSAPKSSPHRAEDRIHWDWSTAITLLRCSAISTDPPWSATTQSSSTSSSHHGKLLWLGTLASASSGELLSPCRCESMANQHRLGPRDL